MSRRLKTRKRSEEDGVDGAMVAGEATVAGDMVDGVDMVDGDMVDGAGVNVN